MKLLHMCRRYEQYVNKQVKINKYFSNKLAKYNIYKNNSFSFPQQSAIQELIMKQQLDAKPVSFRKYF